MSQTTSADLPPAGYPYGPKPAVLPKRSPWPEDSGTLAPWLADAIAVAAMLAVCLAFNAIVPWPLTKLRSNEAVGGIMVGVFATQFGALCAALVFCEARFWLRLPLAWLMGFGLCAAFQLGLHVCQRYHNVRDDLQAFWSVTPLVALAAQLPLWAAKTYLGWRIARPAAKLARPRALSIGDILVGTTLAAVAVMAVRFMPHIDLRDNSVWIGWAIAVSAASGISLVSLLPALYLVLRVEDKLAGGVIYVCYTLVAIGLTLAIIACVNQNTPLPRDLWTVLPLMLLTLAAGLCGLLHLFRWLGYRLVFPGDHWAAAASDGE